MTHQLNPPIPVSITSDRLPDGVKAISRKGWCYAWKDTGIDGHRLWVVVLDETGEVVDTPQPEVRVDMNWSIGRRQIADVGRDLSETKPPCSECGFLWGAHASECSQAAFVPRLNIGFQPCPNCGVKPGKAHINTCPKATA